METVRGQTTLVSVALAALLVGLPAAAEDSPSLIAFVWSEGVETPGFSVAREGWFASVVPAEMDLNGLVSPELVAGERRSRSELLHVDPVQRLCLVESSEALEVKMFPISQAPSPRPGEVLNSISHDSACRSTVAGKDRAYLGERLPAPMLRVRLAEVGHFCRPGTPLVNDRGEIEAVMTGRKLGGEDEAHAIPASHLRKLVREVQRFQRSGPVWIGMVLHEESSTPEILEVKPDSPAASAGMLVGDVVLSLNDKRISDFDALVEAIESLPAGEGARFTVLRGLDQQTLEVVPRFADIE